MPEEHSRFKQYEYEQTGEHESLLENIDPKSLAERVSKEEPPELEEMKKNIAKKKRNEREPLADGVMFTRQTRRHLLQEDSALISYKDDTSAYEAMLSVIQIVFGHQPLDIVTGCADEILAVLKNDNFKNSDKKKEIEKFLCPISSQVLDKLVNIGKFIIDYRDGGDAAGSGTATGDDALDVVPDDDVVEAGNAGDMSEI